MGLEDCACLPLNISLTAKRVLQKDLDVFYRGLSRCLLLPAVAVAFLWSSQLSAESITYREFLASRSAVELKIPLEVVIARRAERGEPLPQNLRTGLQRGRTADAANEDIAIYKLEGLTTWILIDALADLGVAPHYVSSTQAYVTAYMSTAQLTQLAETPALNRATRVIGPTAQGQMFPFVSHRVAAASSQGNPALTGKDVVIGLISLPFKAADKTALDNQTGLIPSGNKLHVLPSAVDNNKGTKDALNLLQVIFDIAPGATVVLASPGVDGVPEQMGDVVADLADGTTQIPAANIIIDDLFFVDQNPFALDQLSAAIKAVREDGAVYITAAGDGGGGIEDPANNGWESTSDVHFGSFSPVEPPAEVIAIDNQLAWVSVHSFGGRGYLQTEEALDRVCFFWNERPSLPGASIFFTLWVYDSNNALIVSAVTGMTAPGGCSTASIPAGAKLVLDLGTGNLGAYRFMLSGERSVAPSALAYAGPVFDLPTIGGIRGHASVQEAVTVGGTKLCTDSPGTPYKSCSALNIGAYSADGDNGNARFYWKLNGNTFDSISEPSVAPKPNLTAAGVAQVGISGSSVYPSVDYVGTSVSAAVTAGIAALYWEYRSAAMTGVALAREIEAALRDATLDDAITAGFDGDFGWGVLDAPKALDPDNNANTNDIADGNTVFDEPLPAEEVAVTSVVGGIQISFKKALDDPNGNSNAFRYRVTCNDTATYNQMVLPSDSALTVGDSDKAPHFIATDPGQLVTCTVLPFKHDSGDTDGYPRSAVSAKGAGGVVSPVSVTMTAKAGGAVLEFDASTTDDGQQNIAYEAACTNQGSAIAGWDPNASTQPDKPYVFEAEPAQSIACTVTVVATSNNVVYRSTAASASATAQSLQSPTVSITPDAGGISVTWTISNIAQSSMATGSLLCTDAGTGAVVIDNEAVAYGGGFVAAPAGVALNCALTTTVRINNSVFATNTTSDVAVTPEEALSSGLPIWLLYQATQQ